MATTTTFTGIVFGVAAERDPARAQKKQSHEKSFIDCDGKCQEQGAGILGNTEQGGAEDEWSGQSFDGI